MARAKSFAALVRPASLFSLVLGLAVAGVLGLTPLGGRLVRAVARAAGRGLGLAGAARRRVPRGHRPAGDPAVVGVRRGGVAPLRALHPQLGAVAARRHRLDRDRRRPDRARAAGPGCAGPPVAADVVGLGRRRGGRRSSWSGPSSGRWSSSRPSTASSRCRPASCAATCCTSREENGTPVQDVLVTDASRRTTALNAYVSGFGSTRRIVVYDTVLAELPGTQIESIVAHELGHVAANDVVTGTLMGALGAAAGVAALGWLLSMRRGATALGADSPGDPRIVPLVLFLIAIGTLVSTPRPEPGLPADRGPRRRARPRPDPRPRTPSSTCSADWPRPTSPTPIRPPCWQWFFGRTRRLPSGLRSPQTGNGWTGHDPHPGGHQRLPPAAGRHPDLRGGAAGPPPAGLGRRAGLGLPGSAAYDAALPYPVVRRPTGMLLPTRATARAAAELARRHGCDSAFFGAAAPLGLLAPALRAAGVGHLVGATHGHETGWVALPGSRQLLQRIAGDLDVLTYISDYTRGRFAPALGGRTRLAQLSPGVDVDRFTPDADGARGPAAVRARRRRPSSCACPGWSPARARTCWSPAGRGSSPGIPTRGCSSSAAARRRRAAAGGRRGAGWSGPSSSPAGGAATSCRRTTRPATCSPCRAAPAVPGWTSRGSGSSSWRRPPAVCPWWPAPPAARRRRCRTGVTGHVVDPRSPTPSPPRSRAARRPGPGPRDGRGRPGMGGAALVLDDDRRDVRRRCSEPAGPVVAQRA